MRFRLEVLGARTSQSRSIATIGHARRRYTGTLCATDAYISAHARLRGGLCGNARARLRRLALGSIVHGRGPGPSQVPTAAVEDTDQRKDCMFLRCGRPCLRGCARAHARQAELSVRFATARRCAPVTAVCLLTRRPRATHVRMTSMREADLPRLRGSLQEAVFKILVSQGQRALAHL